MRKLTLIHRCCLVITHSYKPEAATVLLNCSQYLENAGLKVINIALHDLKSGQHLRANYDFALTCGGDGLCILIGRLLADTGIPIYVVNLGTVGFMAGFSSTTWQIDLQNLVKGNLYIQSHVLLNFCVLNQKSSKLEESRLALNEVILKSCDYSGICEFDMLVGTGQLLKRVRSDGLLVATPTGSTAYALSCGGPIVMNEANCFLVLAINPHSLSYRPLVVSGNEKIILKLANENRRNVSLFSDGELLGDFLKDDILQINFSKKSTHFVVNSEYTFFSALCHKLGWGIDTELEH